MPGKNKVTYRVDSTDISLIGYIYLFDINTKIVISDIDGTITKYLFQLTLRTDVRG